MKPDLRDIGERVANYQDELLKRDPASARARARVIATARGTTGFSRLSWLVASSATALALTLALLWVNQRAPSGPNDRLSFEMGQTPQAGVSGEWLEAPATRSLPIRFSDGSLLEAQPQAQLRVTTHNNRQVAVVLEQGVVDAHVARQRISAWILRAGPFAVRVVGTRFRLAWAPHTQSFSLRLDEGEVKVSGGPAGVGRTVRTGQTLAFSLANTATTGSVEEPRGATDVAVSPPSPSPHEIVHPPLQRQPKLQATASSPQWKTLAAAERYREALASLSSQERAHMMAHGDASDLIALANVARYAGHAEHGRQFLLAVRRRFASDARAAEAAFLLGRIAFENQRQYADAARWWHEYAREQPQGPLAREAFGRRIEALAHAARKDAGQRKAAEQAAREYLRRHPVGPHAAYAKALLAR